MDYAIFWHIVGTKCGQELPDFPRVFTSMADEQEKTVFSTKRSRLGKSCRGDQAKLDFWSTFQKTMRQTFQNDEKPRSHCGSIESLEKLKEKDFNCQLHFVLRPHHGKKTTKWTVSTIDKKSRSCQEP